MTWWAGVRAFLAAVNPKVWLVLAIAVATAAYTLAVYHAGGVKPRAELAQLRDKIRTDGEAQKAALVKQQKDHDDLVKKKDGEHEEELAAADAFWNDYIERLPKPSRTRAAAQPVRIASKICNDPARDNELSGAMATAGFDLIGAITDYRAGIARMLRAAEVQTGDLVNVQDWAAHESLINAVPAARR